MSFRFSYFLLSVFLVSEWATCFGSRDWPHMRPTTAVARHRTPTDKIRPMNDAAAATTAA